MSYDKYVRAIGGVVGAGVGIYSQDGSEHPFASTVASAGAGYVGQAFAKSLYDNVVQRVDVNVTKAASLRVGGHTFNQFADLKTGVAGRINERLSYFRMLEDKINKDRDLLNALPEDDEIWQFSKRGRSSFERRLAKNEEKLSSGLNKYLNNVSVLTGENYHGTQIFQLENVLNDVLAAKYDAREFVSKVNQGMSFDGFIQAHEVGQPTGKINVKRSVTIPSSTPHQAKIDAMTSFFRTDLGMTQVDAEEQAKGLANALRNHDLQISESGMEIKNGNKVVGTMPLSKYNTQGGNVITTVEKNGMNYISKKINPFGALLIGADEGYTNFKGNLFGEETNFKIVGGLTSATNELSAYKGYNPEMLLAFESAVSGRPLTDDQIKDVIGRASTSHVLIANDSRVGPNHVFSGKAVLTSGAVDVTETIGVKRLKDGKQEYRFRKIETVAGKGETRSEVNAIFQALYSANGENIKVGTGKSGTSEFFGPLNNTPFTASFAAAEERHESIVPFRETLPIPQAEDSLYVASKGAEAELLSRSSVRGLKAQVNRDVVNAFSFKLGGNIAIGDGAGLFDLGQVDKFTSYKHKELVFGIEEIAGNRTILAAKNELFNTPGILASTQDQLDEHVRHLNEIGFTIKSGEKLGIGRNGETVSVGREFSHATVKRISIENGAVRVQLDAIARPDEMVKIHSVDSKAVLTGVDSNSYKAIVATSIMESEGRLKLRADGKFDILDKSIAHLGNSLDDTISVDKLLELSGKLSDADGDAISDYSARTFKGYLDLAGRTSFVTGWDESGLDDVNKILHSSKPTDAYLGFLSRNKAIANDDFFKGVAGKSRIDMANAVREIMMVNNQKASQSVFLTTIEGLHRIKMTEMAERLERAKQDILSGNSNKIAEARNTIREAVGKVYATSAMQTLSYGQWTPQELQAITGAGNRGSMSRLEYANMRRSGFSDEIIDSFAKQDMGSLYEAQQIVDEGMKRGNFDIDIRSGKNHEQAFRDAFNSDTQSRLNILRGVYDDVAPDENNILRYNLSTEVSGYKSIAIPLEDTAYSGLNLFTENESAKQMDRLRHDVIQADLAYRRANQHGKEVAYAGLNDVVTRLSQYTKDILSGDGLLKSASRRTAENSKIRTARIAGGAFDQLAQERVAQGLSDNIAAYHMGDWERLNASGKLRLEHVKDSVFRVVHADDGSAYMEHFTREPAQGAGNSIGHEIFIDKSIKERGSYIFFSSSEKNIGGAMTKGNPLERYAFMDYDIDPIRAISTLDMSPELRAQYRAQNSKALAALDEIAPIIAKMGVKGTKKDFMTLYDFKDSMSYRRYLMDSAIKADLAKTIAPEVTNIVSDMSEAIARGTKGTNNADTMLARTIAANLTENLLKSKHKSTLDTAKNPRGFAEDIRDLSEAYKRGETSMGGKPLNFDKQLRSIVDQAIGGGVPELSEVHQAKYSKALDLVVDSLSESIKNPSKSSISFNEMVKSSATLDATKRSGSIFSGLISSGGFKTLASSVGESAKHAIKINTGNLKTGIMKAVADNKNLLMGAAAGLGTLALASGGQPEVSAATQPRPAPQTLPALSDKKAYTYKYKENGAKSIRANVTASGNLNKRSIDQVLNGNNVSNNVTIVDRSGVF